MYQRTASSASQRFSEDGKQHGKPEPGRHCKDEACRGCAFAGYHSNAMYNLYIMQNDQALARTQIYLTQAQQARLTVACRRSAATKSELIRRAIDQFLEQQPLANANDKVQRLKSIAGMWAERSDMADPAAYVRALRAPRFKPGT